MGRPEVIKQINEIPVKTTRPNRHYRDPNYPSAVHAQLERMGRRKNHKSKQSRYEDQWNDQTSKAVQQAKERAETTQDDNIYIRAITAEQEQNLETTIQQSMAYHDLRRYPSNEKHKQISWISCTAHYCALHQQAKLSNNCFPMSIQEHMQQKPYLIVDTVGYRLSKQFLENEVMKFTAHKETRERALTYIQNRRTIDQWRYQRMRSATPRTTGKRQQLAVPLEPQTSEEPEPMTLTRALRSTTHGQRTCLDIQVRIKGKWLTALVDSGADINAINPRTVNTLQLPWQNKTQPYLLTNLEGGTLTYDGGLITREINHLKVFVGTRRHNVDLDIVPTPGYDLMLGYPWLYRYNPHFHWRTGQIISMDDPSDADTDSESNDEQRSQTSTETASEVRREKNIHPPPKGARHKYEKGKRRHVRRTLATVTAQLYDLNEKLKSEPRKPPEEDRLKNVPQEYQVYNKLFKEELDTKVPQHSRWDHEIILKSDDLPFQKIYNLNELELTTLRDYLEEELQKGNIRESTSLAGFPVMFVPKKNGKLRLVVDYRRLNDLTVKDRTPLPLITELKDRLQGKQIFTALDLKGAYNLIRIKEGDEWKTAFRTKFGLFEYLVMPFGLTNAPATFQRMINNVLRQYLDVFVVCYLDDILIFLDNKEEHQEHIHKVLKALQDANLLVEPEKIKEVQSFLGFANYYRQFIRDFSKLANPLTELTKKDQKFEWNNKAQDAFDKLRNSILSEPVLIMFNPNEEIELETDSSDFALGGQIGQRDSEGRLHPIAFYSHKLHGAELRYPIYNKEFLAIVNCFKEFRHYLMGSKHQVKVYTNHQNISHFATTQELNRQQLRYAEYLCEFDFVIIHRKGSDNGRANAISRRPDFEEGATCKAQEQLLEKNKKGEYQFTQPARMVAKTRKEPITLEKWCKDHAWTITKEYTEKCPQCNPGKSVAKTNKDSNFLREFHSHPLHGHQGVTKTLKRLQEKGYRYTRQDVEQIVKQCDVCIRTKAQRHKPYGTLQPLPVAQRPWDSITMDFITKLPLSEEPSTGIFYDSIMVIVDRLTKFSYYLPYRESTDAEELSYVFYRHIVSTHGLPNEILSDRGPTFAAKFWQALMSHLGLNHRLSTAFRPQTDGQTERMNQVLEQYLRCYINYGQNNWVEKLPVAQLAYNTAYNESTKLTPAYANFRFTPDAYHNEQDAQTINPAAILKAEELKNLHEEIKTELEFVRKRMKKYYDTKRIKRPTFKEGEMVYLSAKNIQTKRPSHKLDYKYLRPYKIIKKISENNYKLDLPPKPTRYKSKSETNPKKSKDQNSTKQKQSGT
ncbi:pol polyprotein [Fusarium flagelliforme]|uniref:Pol polyprotein n=1 Tax=Fusarium flagelliforme TaxID=2675880 RepID=A0A395M6N3_9HYPO|nr:pol polyprotein [Fusarium flagelliforme]